MAQYESALDELASRLTGTDASLASSLSDILTAALLNRPRLCAAPHSGPSR